MKKKSRNISFYVDSPIFENIDKLKKIYNIKTNSKILEHIVDLELLKHNLKK